MAISKLLFALVIFVIALQEIFGHGMLWDPVNRLSAWKKILELQGWMMTMEQTVVDLE